MATDHSGNPASFSADSRLIDLKAIARSLRRPVLPGICTSDR